MNATLGTVLVIVSIVAGVVGVYTAARSSVQESRRQREAFTKDQVDKAVKPLNKELADSTAAHEREVTELRGSYEDRIAELRGNHREQLISVRDQCASQLAEANRVIDRRDAAIRDQANRIDQLEDELRRGRGHGETDASRQPH